MANLEVEERPNETIFTITLDNGDGKRIVVKNPINDELLRSTLRTLSDMMYKDNH